MMALWAMSHVSLGADLIANWENFSSLTSTVGDYTMTMTTSGSTDVSDGVLNVVGASGGSAKVDLSGTQLSLSDGLSINMVVSNVKDCGGTWPHGFTSLAGEGDNFYLLWGTNSSFTELKAAYNGSSTKIATSTEEVDYSAITGNTPVTLTMTFSTQETAIYVNGELAAKATAAMQDRAFTTLALGSWVGSSNNGRLSESVHSLSLYKGAMTATEVKELVSVPEPTTGTLSLLALAGLCARRRKH